MENPFRIVCAVDASPPAAAAFEQALVFRARTKCTTGAWYTLYQSHGSYSWGGVERVAALAALRERAEALNVEVMVRVQQGDTAGLILLHARAQAADLVVLGVR